MLKVKNIITVEENEDNYLSFPDIIRSAKNPNHYFMVFRSGNGHHPTISKLVLKKSENKGRTWKTIQEFILTIEDDKYVWNCPRLSYVSQMLYIICDAKSSTFETMSRFKTYFLTSKTEGEFFRATETPFTGMVPDKIIPFKNEYFCANHKIKNERNELIQLVSWSRDGKIWYDTNVVAHSLRHQFCEASIVNVNNDYMIAYLRDNSGHMRNVYTVKSKDGINWGSMKELPIFGQRVTALKYDNQNIIGAFRNTKNINVSLFKHNIVSGDIKVLDIDEDIKKNQYNYGYTGLAEGDDEYLLTYYIKKKAPNPYIKLAFIGK
jgi:sucrose-6-phosphate hydrolase SacC (GH32 family)